MPRFNWAEIEFGGEVITAVRNATLPLRPYCSKIEISSPSLDQPRLIEHAEDPRFFIHRGRLYCYYTLPIERDRRIVYKVRVTELDALLCPVATYTIEYGHGKERNWGFFTRGDELYAVYDPDGFKVLHFSDFEVADEYITPGLRWSHGRACGSTPPVEHNGRLSMFFHSRRRERTWNGRPTIASDRTYYIGYCEFEPDPPFRAVRYSAYPIPLKEADEHMVIFPCSASRNGAGWRLACGFDDKRNGVVCVSDDAIERSMSRGVAQFG